MSISVTAGGVSFARGADRALAVTVWALAIVILTGELVFAASVALFYAGLALQADWAGWNRFMSHGYLPGHRAGNAVVATHLAAAVLLMAGGALQLVPGLRRRAPRLHRWTGRLYIAATFAAGLAALYMIWVRGSIGGMTQHVSLTVQAIVMMLCAVMALRYARAGKIAPHRRWALRLFLVVGGVWFFRVEMMLWLMIFRGPYGFDPVTFTGPAIVALGIASWLAPLLVLQLYFRAAGRGVAARLAVAAGLAALTLVLGAGIAAAAATQWVPLIQTALDARISMARLLSDAIATGGPAAAAAQYHRIAAGDTAKYRINEDDLNLLGYQYIHSHQYKNAIAVLSLNAEAHPQSGNCFDSLGEAYMDDGQARNAIAAYATSLRLDPGNANAAHRLQRLGAAPAK